MRLIDFSRFAGLTFLAVRGRRGWVPPFPNCLDQSKMRIRAINVKLTLVIFDWEGDARNVFIKG